MAKKKSAKKRAAHEGGLGRLGALLRSFVFGGEVEDEEADRLQEIKGLILIGLSLWVLLSLVSYFTPPGDPAAEGRNWGGQAGHYLATWIFMGLGWGGYFLTLLGISWGIVLVGRKHVDWPTLRLFGAVCFTLSSAFLLELAFGASHGPSNDLPYGPGGWMAMQWVGGADASPVLVEKFGLPGLWILLGLVWVISFMLATEMAFWPAIVAFREWREERAETREETLGQAVAGWTKNLGLGLWDFLRGADLTESAAATTGKPAAGKKSGGRGRKAAQSAKGKAKKDKAKGKAATPLLDYDPDSELEEDDALVDVGEAEDWEYVDEDGNPIDPAEMEDYDLEGELEDDEEYEDEDEDGYDDEEEYEDEEEYDDEEYEEEGEDEEAEEPEPVIVPAKAKAKKGKTAKVTQAAETFHFEPPTPPAGPWKFPPLDLLEPPGGGSAEDQQHIELQARKLENALSSFRVEASVVGAKVGPAVTMFEIEVSQGTRMNKVTALSQEIAAALRAKSVRIIAPIPGRSTVGIEVPNAKRRIVRMSELITQQAYDKGFAALPLFLGMDAEGGAIVADLARMPHLLIAGTTGSGKSVCINTILASLLLTRSPHDVQMVLVDPKMVELQMFSKVPHLMLPVVTDMRQATNVLLWAVEKMEGRYEVFKSAGVKNIRTYNALGEEGLRERMGDEFHEERTPRHVPYIIVVIDEMADLMMISKKEAEQAITRLAQKSRAVGIHVIVATQRPSTDVITGVLKGNLPTRIAFQVASKIDSRVILDAQGAEKLLGQGDMLYTPPQSSQILRVQGALVEDHELQAVVDFVCEESAPTFSQELIQAATGTAAPGAGGGIEGGGDDLWDEAVRVVLKSRRGSASLLQRALGIGYTRASRLIDLMTNEGIVGDYKGSKAREVLLSLEDWEEMQGATAGPGDG